MLQVRKPTALCAGASAHRVGVAIEEPVARAANGARAVPQVPGLLCREGNAVRFRVEPVPLVAGVTEREAVAQLVRHLVVVPERAFPLVEIAVGRAAG